MTNSRIVKYYVFMNNAFLYKNDALVKLEPYSHKGEKISEIFVIVDSNDLELNFCLDSCFYNYFNNYESALEELNSWD